MSENGVKTMKDFAAEIGVSRVTVAEIVAKRKIPTERMTHGMAKGLSTKTQEVILQILSPEPADATA